MIIKVLHIGLSSNYGGIENVVHSWYKNKPKDIQFDFINDGNFPLAFSKEYEKGNCHIFKVTHRYNNCIKRYLEIKKIVKQNNYDYIHFHVMDIDDAVPIIIGNKQEKCNVIVHCHSSHGNEATLKEKILKFITKIELIGCKYIRFSCGKDAGFKMFNSKEFVVIENGIELDKYKYSESNRNKIRKQYSISNEDFVIGHIGHSCYEKNYPFIISSFAELYKKNNKYKLMLIGNMSIDESIIRMVKEKNMDNQVIFTGVVDNVDEYYSSMDAFYLPSINEGFPLTLVEAQAAGLDCVISKSITDDVILTDKVHRISFNNEEAIDVFEKILINENKRKDTDIDNKYDHTVTSKKLFDFYYNN